MRWIHAGGYRVSVIGLGGRQFGTPAWGWGRRDFGPAEARAICARAARARRDGALHGGELLLQLVGRGGSPAASWRGGS